MKIILKDATWDQALTAMQEAGKFARHDSWHTNCPPSAPTYVGPVMMGAFPLIDGGQPVLTLFTDTGVRIQTWAPTPKEFASKDWQIVEIAVAPAALPPAPPAAPPPEAPPVAEPTLPAIDVAALSAPTATGATSADPAQHINETAAKRNRRK